MTNKRKRRLIIGLLSLVIVVLVAKLAISRLNAPAEGSITTPTATAPTEPAIDMSPRIAAGPYALFKYPSAMTQGPDSHLGGSVLAAYNFTYQDVESWHLAIAILSVPSGQLIDNNSYQVRKINPQQYKASQLMINKQTVPVMTDSTVGGFSKVAFLVHGRYQATVSLYGDDATGTAPLQATFNMVLSSWQWLAN